MERNRKGASRGAEKELTECLETKKILEGSACA